MAIELSGQLEEISMEFSNMQELLAQLCITKKMHAFAVFMEFRAVRRKTAIVTVAAPVPICLEEPLERGPLTRQGAV